MRVLYLVHQYLPEHVGGTELYTQSVARALADSGHQVGIFYRRSADGVGLARRNDDGVAVWAAWASAPSPTRRFLATFGDPPIQRAFQEVLDQARPDLVHVQHLMGLPAQLLGAVSRRHIPMVVTLHDYWWICANAQLVTNYDQTVCRGPAAGWLNCGRCALARGGAGRLWPAAPGPMPLLAWRERILRGALSRAARIIAPTRFVKDWYAEHGLAADRIEVLPHGITRSNVPGTCEVPGTWPDRPSAPFRIAYIGGLSWQKGVHVLIEAFNHLPPGAELWIGGDESFDPTYARSLHTRARPGVIFLGALSHTQVWETLRQVDAVAVPSLWYETFSLIAHEAFAAGVPVVASRLGALAEAVRDDVDGLLVPPGDVDAWRAVLQRLMDDPATLARLRAGVQRPLELAQHIQRLSDIYAQVVVGASGSEHPIARS